MVDKRKPVLLIHGIQTEGHWQDEIEPALKWFFRPVHIRYSEFRYLGPLLVISEPFLLVPGVVLCIGSLWIPRSLLALCIGILFVLLSLSKFGLSFRRGAALDKYHKISGDDLIARPHVIAHSFGTYLTGRLISEVDAARVSRVVLVGCVMPRAFDWKTLIANKKLEEVRNDYSPMDFVAAIAGFAGWIHKDLGPAGKYGFGSLDAHQLDSPNQICAECDRGSKAVVHDVKCEHMTHSGAFVARAHAASYWLPFFWNMDAGEYLQLLEYCGKYAAAIDSADPNSLHTLEVEAQSTKRRLLGGLTLWDTLKKRLVTGDTQPSQVLVSRALMQFCTGMTYASFDKFQTEVTKLLDPRNALTKAVVEARSMV